MGGGPLHYQPARIRWTMTVNKNNSNDDAAIEWSMNRSIIVSWNTVWGWLMKIVIIIIIIMGQGFVGWLAGITQVFLY